MYEFVQGDETKAQVRRLLRYRVHLILAMMANVALIVQVSSQSASEAIARHGVLSRFLTGDSSSPPHTVAPRRTPLKTRELPPGSGHGVGDTHGAPETPSGTPAAPEVDVQPDLSDAPATVPDDGDVTSETLAEDGPATSTTVAAATSKVEAVPVAVLQRGIENLFAFCAQAAHKFRQEQSSPTSAAGAGANLQSHPLLDSPEAVATRGRAAAIGARREDEPSSRSTPLARQDAGLVLSNPLENNAKIRFLLDDRPCELGPGETHEFPPGEERQIKFHRGGEFGNASEIVTPGAYRFTVTKHGWELSPVEAPNR